MAITVGHSGSISECTEIKKVHGNVIGSGSGFNSSPVRKLRTAAGYKNPIHRNTEGNCLWLVLDLTKLH